jgi:phosphoesterase RecJ-like protein
VRAVDRRTATCLLTGLITDTGSFSNLATTASAVDVAAKLLAKGANLPQISKQALQYRPYNSLKLWGRALERLHEDPTTGMIVTAVTLQDIHECNADEEAVSGISNFLNGLDQAAEKIIMVLAQSQPGVIKGSLRTTHPLLDVTEFAKLYGGGGHKKAAGFSLTGTLELTPTGYVIKPA